MSGIPWRAAIAESVFGSAMFSSRAQTAASTSPATAMRSAFTGGRDQVRGLRSVHRKIFGWTVSGSPRWSRQRASSASR